MDMSKHSISVIICKQLAFSIGLLSEVIDSKITQINSTSLLLQYTAPYTLTGVPILYYNILILPTNISVNITGTQYNIHITEYCINYNISITPWNSVGMGNTTTLYNVVIYQGKYRNSIHCFYFMIILKLQLLQCHSLYKSIELLMGVYYKLILNFRYIIV